MAAEVETGVYNVERGLPWHKLGVANPGYMDAATILREAQLDWLVEKVPLYTCFDGEYEVIADHFGIQRTTDLKNLGVVGNRYHPAQNEEVLSFMDNIIGSGQAVYDTAWSLRGGKTVAITAELEPSTTMPKGEEFKTYLTAMNNHDGSGKIRLINSNVRVVCMNTLALAVRQAKMSWERKHTQNWNNESAMVEARNSLEMARRYESWMAETAKQLISEAFSKKDFESLAFQLIVGDNMNAEGDIPTQTQNKLDNLKALYVNSDNLGNIRKTKWGALNAVIEFVDYESNYRGADKDDKRAESIMFGRGSDLKTKAYELLVA